MRFRRAFFGPFSLVMLIGTVAAAASPQVSFEQSASEIDACDFLEIVLKVAEPTAKNPFQEIAVTGRFQGESGPPHGPTPNPRAAESSATWDGWLETVVDRGKQSMLVQRAARQRAHVPARFAEGNPHQAGLPQPTAEGVLRGTGDPVGRHLLIVAGRAFWR